MLIHRQVHTDILYMERDRQVTDVVEHFLLPTIRVSKVISSQITLLLPVARLIQKRDKVRSLTALAAMTRLP